MLNVNREVRIRDYLSMLQRRIRTILVVFSTVMLSVGLFVWQKPDIYHSHTTIVIEEPQSALALAGLADSRRPIGFYKGILSSRSYLEEVRDSIGLDLFVPLFPGEEIDSLAFLSYIKDHITLGATSFQSLLQFSAEAGTKELAYALAKKGTSVFRKKCAMVETEESRQAVEQIEKQLVIIRDKLETAEQEYQRFREKTGLVGDSVTNELKFLQEVYYKEKTERTLARAEYFATKKQLESLESKITPKTKKESPQVKALRKKLQELEKEKRRLISMNISISPASSLQRQIDETERELLLLRGKTETTSRTPNQNLIGQWQALRSKVAMQELDNELSLKRIQSYKQAIDRYKREHPEILEQRFELSRKARAKKIYEETYNILQGKAEEAKLKGASQTGGIKLIDPAYMPRKPISKNTAKLYVAGALIGLFLGIGIAFFLEINDTTIKSSEDIERTVGLPVIGTIPHIVIPKNETIDIKRSSGRNQNEKTLTRYPKNLVNFGKDDSIASEAYRSLRTNLLYSSPDKPLRTIMITSSGPGEGKSLTVSNIAMAFAKTGSRVLLVDTDLRRPVIHHLFQVRREPGFCELFLGNTHLEEVVKKTNMENLSILTAGRFTPNPAELLGAHKMQDIIDLFASKYDIVFFDAPPLVAVTDAAVLSTKTDGVALIVKSLKTEREFIKRAINVLEAVGTRIIGAVLNDIDLTNRYSSYGYYKYYYHYSTATDQTD